MLHSNISNEMISDINIFLKKKHKIYSQIYDALAIIMYNKHIRIKTRLIK